MTNKSPKLGIDFGTSNLCAGIYMNGIVKIVPNKIGERITPSVLLFEDNGSPLVGEEVINKNPDNTNDLIYEIKRFIGLNYKEFEEGDFKKFLNYDVKNIDGIPKIKINNIKGKEEYKSAEEISSYILKKIITSAEDFYDNETGEGIKIRSAVITVPAHFNKYQKNAMRLAALKAGIETTRIINEPTAAALAYGIGKDLIPKNPVNSQSENVFSSILEENDNEVAPLPDRINKTEEKVFVFDLGGGTFDLTLLNIKKINDDHLVFEVILTNGDIHLGGSDFDNALIDYCIKDFCKKTNNDEKEVKNNKMALKRLKIKCEDAKKILSIKNETKINIDNFFGEEDFCIKITIDLFEKICEQLFKKIRNIILEALNDANKTALEIDKIILVGGASRMCGIKNLLKKIFSENIIKDDINPEEAIAIGATLEAAKIEIKDKMNFVLQDITPLSLGIGVFNLNTKEYKMGDLMLVIIEKYKKIPFSNEVSFVTKINENNKKISLNIYEGNKENVKKNIKLGEIITDNITQNGLVEFKVNFNIDVKGELTVSITNSSLGIFKEKTFDNISHGYLDEQTKRIKYTSNKNRNKMLKSIYSYVENISKIKIDIANSMNNYKEQIPNIIECCKNYEELIDKYTIFLKNNESLLEKIFIYTKELFIQYSQRIKLKEISKENIPKIINKIKEKMYNLRSVIEYDEELLMIFKDIRDTSKDEFYEILINYMEILNNEGLNKKKEKKFSRYYSKQYFEKVFYSLKKFVNEKDLLIIKKDLRKRYEKQKEINELELKKVNSFTNLIETMVKEGKFLFGGSGFTLMAQKLKNFEKIKSEEVQEILDLFNNMVNSFDPKDKSIGEGYCLANIIKINYSILRNKDFDKLYRYIDRLETIMKLHKDEKYPWYNEIKPIIKKLENEN